MTTPRLPRCSSESNKNSGRLDLLVNNAAAIHDDLTNPKPFWEKPLELADVLDVGLRSAYVASWHAAPLMVRQGRGLIAFTSSPGSVCYMHGPAYGAQKAGVDKMAADMAVDFRDTGVATISIWMGILLTERFRSAFDGHPEALAETAKHAETPEFTGHLINALYHDPDLAELSGHTVIGAETRAALRHHRRGRPAAAVAPGHDGCAAGAEPGDRALNVRRAHRRRRGSRCR